MYSPTKEKLAHVTIVPASPQNTPGMRDFLNTARALIQSNPKTRRTRSHRPRRESEEGYNERPAPSSFTNNRVNELMYGNLGYGSDDRGY